MCLAYPGRVTVLDGDFARVDFGEGTIKEAVNVSLVQPKIGDYVLVHAGYAIQIVDEAEARQILEYWRQILAAVPGDREAYEHQLKGGL
jgi:hydrogenase expression/formation protein HypC